MILNQGDFQTYWSRGLFPGIAHQNSRNRSVLNWNLKTPHGLFTPTHPSPFLAWRVPWGMVGSSNLTPLWRRGGGSQQRASRPVNSGVHGFVLLVRFLAVPHWPPGHPKHYNFNIFYLSG